MSEPIVHTFLGCEVHEYPNRDANGELVTVFPDGTRCEANRGSEMHNVDYARHLGYATVRDALREHELAHTFVAERMGFPYSPTLWAVAHGFGPGSPPYHLQLWEEAIVLSFQKYLNTGEVEAPLRAYGVDPQFLAWAEEFGARFRAGAFA